MLRHRRRPPPPPAIIAAARRLSGQPPPPAAAVIRVSNNIASLGKPKGPPKPRQLLSLPRFPAADADPLPGRKPSAADPLRHRHHLGEALLSGRRSGAHSDPLHQGPRSCRNLRSCGSTRKRTSSNALFEKVRLQIKHNEAMVPGMKIHIPVSVAEAKIAKRYDTIPTATLYPNADEISYLQRLVIYKDSAIMVLNKPPKVPVKGNLPVHNSMDVLAAAALSYGNAEGPKLVHRLDRDISGLLLMGRRKESVDRLHWLFSNINLAKSSSKIWNAACAATVQIYWALVIGCPKEREGLISAPISKVILNDRKTERVILAHPSGIADCQEAITEYRVLGPTISGCSWVELRPLTGRKHQLRVHCAEALGTPIVGDYKYGWFVHKKWKQMPRVDYEPSTGTPYKLRRPAGLDVQKGSVLSKVPLLHLHCREMVIPNIAKFLGRSGDLRYESDTRTSEKPDLLRFVASMPSHMKISWNIMSSYLV